ncbi:DNA polymerase IV [Candidatus Bipolaricaulota bacterium]|nr:DNA polymerase IV [Candidatus Bipolaricaulota bacterium]
MPSRNPSVVIPNDRWIGHLDMDAFFAAVEQLDHPEYRGRPVIVGGLGPRGVVSTASYEARPYGVHSALPMAVARRLCPDGICVAPRFLRYREISDHVRTILRRFSPDIETISLDEAFFDLSERGPSFEVVHQIARTIKRDVQAKTKLTCSVGLAPNRFLAKLGSEMDKPDGFMVIDPDQIHEILDPLPVGQIWGMGKVTAKRLTSLGLLRIKDLRLAPSVLLVRELGSTGRRLQQLAMGIDDTPLSGEVGSKSISRETTYSFDVSDFEEMEDEVRRLAGHVARSLRAEHLVCRVVRIKVRYPNFKTITRQSQLGVGTDSPEVIESLALELLRNRVPLDEVGIRLLGVGLGGICESLARQLSLFPDWL